MIAGTLSAALLATSLIPRVAFFQASSRRSFKLSPDGTTLAFVAPSPNGPLTLWIEACSGGPARPATTELQASLRDYEWTDDGRRLLYRGDLNGDENLHLYSIELDSGRQRDLTPYPGVRCDGIVLGAARPGDVLAMLNRRDPRVFDVHRIDIGRGTDVLDTENPGDVLSWVADRDLVVRAAMAFRERDAATVVRVRDSAGSPWRDLLALPFEESTLFGQVNGGSVVVGFDPTGQRLQVVSSLGSENTRLVEIEPATGGVAKTIASSPRGDIWRDLDKLRFIVLREPRTGQVQAVPFDFERPEWQIVDESLAKDFAFLQAFDRGTLAIQSRDLSDTKWIVQFSADDAPPREFLYEREKRSLRLLTDRPPLDSTRLSKMEIHHVPARDGFDLLTYLTKPRPARSGPAPTVLLIHGGPWHRDEWGYSPIVQFLASRGYAVLQVQYRGSDGLGKRCLNAGNREMGRKTDDDLTDAVRWAIERGTADPKRIAAMGYSFGGYHVLRALELHPDLYSGGVSIVGLSDLRTSLQVLPEYWKPVLQRHVLRLGNVLEDARLDEELSPLFHAGDIRAPTLLAHGANDVRDSLKDSERFVSALRAFGRPVEFVVYSDEGHFIGRPANLDDLFGRIEEFLHRRLGGAREPWRKVPGSSAELR